MFGPQILRTGPALELNLDVLQISLPLDKLCDIEGFSAAIYDVNLKLSKTSFDPDEFLQRRVRAYCFRKRLHILGVTILNLAEIYIQCLA